MRMKLNRFFRFIGVSLAISLSISAVEISNTEQAVDMAGKQRMFAFRILKDYLMVSMESEYKNPKENMVESLKDFSETQLALKKYVKDKHTQSLLTTVDKDFAEVEKMTAQPFKKENGDTYLKEVLQLRSATHEVVLSLQQASGEKSAEVINKMGRLRAVSQKINAIYLLKTMGISSEMTNKGMESAMKTFKDSLDFLMKTEFMDTQMQKKIKKLSQIYRFFQVMNESDNYVPTIISKKSDKMLKYADELTKLYINKKN